MKISTLALVSLTAAALTGIAACSKEKTESPASVPPPGPEAAAPRAAGSPPSSDQTAAVEDATGGGAAAPAQGAASGEQIFQTNCATCHGPKGAGDGPAAAALNPKPAALAAHAFKLDPNGNGKKGEVDDIKAVVRDGAAKYGGSPLMAPWPMLSDEQLQAVAEYVQSLEAG